MTHGMFAYEATLHVPLIVAEIRPNASRETRGVVIDTPVRHIDIAPTVLEAAGAATDGALPGLSLRDLIRAGSGPDRPQYFESMTYNLVRGWAPLRGVLVARSKYIDLPIPELYDLVADPKEAANLAPKAADRVQVLLNTLKTYNVAPPDRPGQVSAEDVAALRALGYSSGSAAAKTTYTEADDPKQLVQVDTDLHSATTLYQDGKVPEAIAMLTSVITRRPDTADAYIQLAHAYYEAGQVQQAIDTLDRGMKAGAPERDIRIRLGIYLAEGGGNSARAIQVLEHVSTTDVEALNGLGIAYIDARRYADAERTFNRVLALDPTNGLAYWNLAVVTLKEADDIKAAADKAAKLQRSGVIRAAGRHGGPVSGRRVHDARRRLLVHGPQGRGDRELEARGRARRHGVLRAVQPLARAGRGRADGRCGEVRASVRGHGAVSHLSRRACGDQGVPWWSVVVPRFRSSAVPGFSEL